MAKVPPRKKPDTAANLGFEAKLWAAADALRNNMDAAEYKHVVLGLIFLKYISDAFEAKHAGRTSRPTHRSPLSAHFSTMRWPQSNATTRR